MSEKNDGSIGQDDDVTEWDGDVLKRKKYSLFLTDYLVNKNDAFVININASWGSGKTFFIENWHNDIKDNYPAVLFNAWENDFSNDPFLSVISCINKTLIPLIPESDETNKFVRSFFSSSGRILKQVAPILAKGAVSKLIGEDGVNALSDVSPSDESIAAELVGKVTENLINENEKSEKAVSVFKESLASIIAQITTDTKLFSPLFVFIDELDRCRPLYAIELLERVKHLFGIPEMVFVISTDTEQLRHSVKAIYGNDFDAEMYLKRFFDQTYSLPLPNCIEFSKMLFKEFSLNKRFVNYYTEPSGDSKGRILDSQNYKETNEFTLVADGCSYYEPILLFALFSDLFGLNLRSQQQCFEKLTAIISFGEESHEIHISYLIFLIMLESKDASLFEEYFNIPVNDANARVDLIIVKFMSEANIRVSDKLYRAADFIAFYSKYAFLETGKLRESINSPRGRNVMINNWSSSILDNYDSIKSYKENVMLAGALS